MKSEKRLICPVTNQRAKPTPFSDEQEGVFVILDEEDDEETLPDHPVGWGALTLRVVIPNPFLAEMKGIREAARAEALEQLTKLSTDENVEPAQRQLLKGHLESGKAQAEIDANVDEQHPLPEQEYVTARLTYPVLGSEAVGTLVQKLREAGFRFALPGEEVA